MDFGRFVGHPDVGTHNWVGADSFGGCCSDKEFESTPGSQSSRANPEEISEMLVMKSIRWREVEKFQTGSPAWIRTTTLTRFLKHTS